MRLRKRMDFWEVISHGNVIFRTVQREFAIKFLFTFRDVIM